METVSCGAIDRFHELQEEKEELQREKNRQQAKQKIPPPKSIEPMCDGEGRLIL
jgi:hypothetical protein